MKTVRIEDVKELFDQLMPWEKKEFIMSLHLNELFDIDELVDFIGLESATEYIKSLMHSDYGSEGNE